MYDSNGTLHPTIHLTSWTASISTSTYRLSAHHIGMPATRGSKSRSRHHNSNTVRQPCSNCGKSYLINGLATHEKSCKKKSILAEESERYRRSLLERHARGLGESTMGLDRACVVTKVLTILLPHRCETWRSGSIDNGKSG